MQQKHYTYKLMNFIVYGQNVYFVLMFIYKLIVSTYITYFYKIN